MLRTLFALASGLFATMLVITLVELANAKLFFPPPPGMDWHDTSAVTAFAASLPTTALAIVLLGWLLGTFVGAAVAAKIAIRHQLPCALLIGSLVAAATVMNALEIPHPLWLNAAGVLLPIPLAHLAARLVQKGFAKTR